MKVTILVWALKLTLPLTAPLTPVTVSGSPFGSVSLASRDDAGNRQSCILRGAVTAVGVGNRRLVGAAAIRCEHDIGPIVGGAVSVGREDAGGAGAAI